MPSRCRSKCRPRAETSPAWSAAFPTSTLKKWTEPTRSPAMRLLCAQWRTAAPGMGPAFVHAHVIRPYSHSLSDDERLYRPDAERQRDAQRDPITRMQMFLIREGILDEKGINRLEKQVDDDLQVATDRALQAPAPTPDTVTAVSSIRRTLIPRRRPSKPSRCSPSLKQRHADGKKTAPKTMADLITATLARRDAPRRAHRDLRRRCRRLQPRRVSEAETGQRQGRRFQADRRTADASSVPTASLIRPSRKPTSWAAPRAWPHAG